ncbi:hypothetical protein FB45DRAFT_1030354 [Roridomyces roridus]|uniref:Uncharacterized protein n=1 Tax=Roridomyces roridus TaxID=1738132 RepID=A0AAD7FLQ2_9AGAR|nr:hypothetical protein FB45DRAFT_1030354 [Roridomyces roridus]
MSALAPELIDLILSHLHPLSTTPSKSENVLDKEAAHNVGKCAGVRKWAAHGLAKLFRTPQRLTFLPFIRVLDLCGGLAEDRWMLTVFPKISKHLPTSIITSLVLQYGNFLFFGLHSFPQFDLPGLTHLQIGGHNMPDLAAVVQFVASWPELVSLKLCPESEDWGKGTLPVAGSSAPATLRHLEFRCAQMGPVLEWIQESHVPLSSVLIDDGHMLPANDQWTGTKTQTVAGFLDSLGSSLTSLSLTFDWFTIPIDVTDGKFLSPHSLLKTLTIGATTGQIEPLLLKARLWPSLESITLNLFDDSPSLPAWSDLDSRLTSLSSLRSLVTGAVLGVQFR